MSQVSVGAWNVILAAHQVSWVHRQGLAATIRASTQECLPIEPEPSPESLDKTIDFGLAWALWYQRMETRRKLLALADEVDLSPIEAGASSGD